VSSKNKRRTSVRHSVFKHKYITQPTLTPEDIIVKALQDSKHAIKGTNNAKGKANFDSLVKMDELLHKEPEKGQTSWIKQVQCVDEIPNVLNYSEDPRVPLTGRVSKSRQQRKVLTIPPPVRSVIQTPAKRGSVGRQQSTTGEPSPRVVVVAIPPRVKMALRRLVVESGFNPPTKHQSQSSSSNPTSGKRPITEYKNGKCSRG